MAAAFSAVIRGLCVWGDIMTPTVRFMTGLRAAWRYWLLAGGLCTLAARAYPVPKGESILRNGDFTESSTKPIHWVTRSTGDLGTFSLTPPAEGEKSGVLHVKVLRAHQQPWMLELRQKLSSSLRKGQTLFLAFEYRMTEGYAFHVYWQKDAPPWPKFLALRISEPVNNWDACLVAVPVPEDLAADKTSLSFHLAEATGEVQFRNIRAIVVDASVDPADIETTVQPVFGGDYYDNDWRAKILERIEKERKRDVRLSLVRDGTPLAGVEVEMRQTSRPFLFGVEVPATVLVENPPYDKQPFTALKHHLGANIDKVPAFRKLIADPSLFSLITLTDALVWRKYDEWGKTFAPPLIDAIRARGQAVRGSAVFDPAFRYAPARCRLMERDELLQAVENHVLVVSKAFRGKLDQWVVLRGVLGSSEIYDIIGVEKLVDIFRTVRKQDPDIPLLIRDDEALLLPSDGRVQELVEFIGWLRSEDLTVDGLVLGAALSRPYMAPQTMEQRLDLIHSSLPECPVYIASLELEADKETTQAAMLRDLLALFYSHPAVHGVSLSSIWEPLALNRRCALFRANMRARRSGRMVRDLLTREWRTVEKGKTDAGGTMNVRAFLGTYHISARVGKKKIGMDCDVGADTDTIVFDVAAAPPAPK